MCPTDRLSDQSSRLGDCAAAARRGRFVGRLAELELVRSALLAAEPPFAVLHVHGPDGIGKSALLREYARMATECARPVIYLDGRNVDPSPAGFLRALRQALGLDFTLDMPTCPEDIVLIVDTFEMLTALDDWFRETFLPQLPAPSLVVVGGRGAPAPAWRTDLGWAALTRIIALRNLRPEESQTYLATCGIPADQHGAVLSFTHGHPLALALVADNLSQGEKLAPFDPRDEPDVVRTLFERFVQDVPSDEHRRALEVCVMAWATTESLLAGTLQTANAHDLFSWLRGLSFIERGPKGIFPHDLARDVLNEDFRWRDPAGYREVGNRLIAHLQSTFERAPISEQQSIWLDLLYLCRHNPVMKRYFDWSALGSAYAEPAPPEHHPDIVAMVRWHQGDAAARIAQHWLKRQPASFLIYRDVSGEIFGFMAHITLHDATPEDLAIDPAAAGAMRFIERQGPLRPGEEILYVRFWMHRDAYQDITPAINLTAINCSIHWMTRPKLAWDFFAVADPDFYEPAFAGIHMWRSPEADFEIGGHRYGVFSHDWRVEPATAWLQAKADLTGASDTGPMRPPDARPSPVVVLSQTEFAGAVRQALRDYSAPERLATNPLLHSRLVVDAARTAEENSPVAILRQLLRAAATSLTANPKDAKLHRALWHTYFEPAPTQEQAAEILGLPFNTYRNHLAHGIDRVTAWLWRRELEGPDE